MSGGCLIASQARPPFAGCVVVLKRQLWKRSSASSVLAPSVSLTPKLGVTTAQMDTMPFTCGHFFE
jgi:hypothetical protein